MQVLKELASLGFLEKQKERAAAAIRLIAYQTAKFSVISDAEEERLDDMHFKVLAALIAP